MNISTASYELCMRVIVDTGIKDSHSLRKGPILKMAFAGTISTEAYVL